MLPTALISPLIRRYNAEGRQHVHDHSQVLFGIDGTLQLEVEGRSVWVDATSGLVIPAGASHVYFAIGTARVLVFDELAWSGEERLRRFALPPGWGTAGLNADRLLETLAVASPIKARRRIDLAQLAQQIDADLSRAWTVAALAALCCLSPQRLRARFAQSLNQSPQAFVRARRLNRAEALLRLGLGLDAVALQVGYSSASALSVALRRERNSGARGLRARQAFLDI